MKKHWKRILAVVLALVLTAGVVSPAAYADGTASFAACDRIEFGSYPQTKVTDSQLIAALNALPLTWQSYGYDNGPGDMLYCDVTQDGVKYRGVTFSQYRQYTGFGYVTNRTYQQNNGYDPNTVYWFLWEPLTWRVLDPDTGLVLCESIIDSQPFHTFFVEDGTDEEGIPCYWGDAEKTHFANSYAHASIRAWLTDAADTGSFLNTAFTETQRAEILPTELDNSAYCAECAMYDSPSTTDKVFLLSAREAENTTYGLCPEEGFAFEGMARGSDYAKCQGLAGQLSGEAMYHSDECSPWLLRTGGSDCYLTSSSLITWGVSWYGYATPPFYTYDARMGVRPALRMEFNFTAHVTQPTCTERGYTTYTCDRCGDQFTKDYTNALGHQYGDWVTTRQPTRTENGEQTKTCIRCEDAITRTIQPLLYDTGDLIEFGSYPQNEVHDAALLAALNAAPQTWISYGYYSGPGQTWRDAANGQMTASDFMQYCDVTYAGERYRGVRFTRYRPYYTGLSPVAALSYQDENGYTPDTTYWFRWEPVVWRVLDPYVGQVMSETALDCQPINNYLYASSVTGAYGLKICYGDEAHQYAANDYPNSSLRRWLTDETDADSFLNTAFDADQREAITPTTITNVVYETGYSAFNGAPTTDAIFLLSQAQVRETAYGFDASVGDHPSRTVLGSDYAFCQGAYSVSREDRHTVWWVRTPYHWYEYTRIVSESGDTDVHMNDVNATNTGVRPAMQVDLTAVAAHAHSYTATVTATCTEGGDTVYTCLCGDSYTGGHEDALGHDFGEWVVTTPATVDADGVQTRTCTRCGTAETRAIPKLPLPASAALALIVPDAPVYTGDEVTVTINLTQNTGLAAMSLALSYDPAVLTLTAVQGCGMLESGTLTCSNQMNAQPFVILWEDATGRERHTETGEIMTLTFTVKETAATGETTLTLTYDAASTFDIDMHCVPLTLSDAAMTVVLHMPGDADGDGILSLQDTTNMMRYLAGGWGVHIDMRNGDVNGDGLVNLRDVVLIRRFLAGGWDVVLQ